LGVDENNAHVQPNGAYHYHGLPTGLLAMLKMDSTVHSPLVGWAADGFPIYAMYGYATAGDAATPVKELHSSNRVKKGDRASGGDNPGGNYDGTFLADYEYAAGSGDLDECNGRQTVTPEFPNGTYAYFLTRTWPVIPRCLRGTPDESFARQRGGGGPGGGFQGGFGSPGGPPPR